MSGKGGRSYADMARRVMGVEQPESSGGFSVRDILDALSPAAQQQTFFGYDPSQGAANNITRSLLGAYNAVKTQPAPYDPQEFWRRANAGEKQDPRAWDNAMAIAGMTSSPGAKRAPLDTPRAPQQAHQQAFDVDLYHGTTFDFPEFQTAARRKTYLTDDPKIANIYAAATQRHTGYGIEPNAGPNVIPLKASVKNPLEVSDLGPDGSSGWFSDNLYKALGKERPENAGQGAYRALFDEARERGHDFVIMRDYTDLGGTQSQYIPLDLTHVRSRFAKFDPAKKDSRELLAGLLGPAVAAGIFGSGNDDGVK